MKISEVLKIQKGITSIIGGGGKTTLMMKLADELKDRGTVVICTTTRIFEPDDIVVLYANGEEEIAGEIENNRIICVSGEKDINGKLTPPLIELDRISQIADYVICEADGSKRLPLKAHATHEPVIPEGSNQTILVMGIDGLGNKIKDVCHRPEIYAQLAGVKQDDVITPELAMRVVNSEQYGTKIYINKVESDDQMKIAKLMNDFTEMEVIAGSLWNGEYRCL